MTKKRSGGTPATAALSNARVPFTLHPYDHDPRADSYGLEAARALGVDPDRVFKTLMVVADRVLVVAVVPVSRQLDLKALARTIGASRATMAEVSEAERATGYVAGGISPFGQKRAHRTVVDDSAHQHPTVFVSAGKRGLDLEVAPDDLLAVTGASLAAISRS